MYNYLLCIHNYLTQFNLTQMLHELVFGENLIYMNIKLNHTMYLKWFIIIKISTHCKNISAKHNTNYYIINLSTWLYVLANMTKPMSSLHVRKEVFSIKMLTDGKL